MITFLIVQLTVDALLAIGLILTWFWRRQPADAQNDQKMTAILNVLESRIQQLDLEVVEYRKKMHAELTRLQRICNEASNILEKNRWRAEVVEPTREEKEIRALLQQTAPTEISTATRQIPTLEQLEKTKERLRAESSLDLRTLLQDQLA